MESTIPLLCATRHPLPIVLTNAQMRRWTEYKKRIGEKKDQAALLVLLAAAMNEDDGKDG